MAHDYDVIIVGAGVVGLTAALALQQAALSAGKAQRILLLDAKTFQPGVRDKFDQRVAAINPNSEHFFKKLNVWTQFQRTSPYKNMFVWDAVGGGEVRFASSEVGQSRLGHILEHQVMLTALHAQCKAVGIDYQPNTQLIACEVDDAGVTLKTQSGRTLQAALLLGADGANSWVRSQCFEPVTAQPYDHHAIIATVATERANQAAALQCFLPTGPLAFLPLNARTCSIVWSNTPEEAKRLMALPVEAFNEAMSQVMAKHLGAAQLLSKRVCIPLYRRHAKQYVRNRVALLGDAAHTIHPLAGQGLNLGIADAHQLAQCLEKAWQQERDATAMHTLQRYARARKARNQEMLWLMDGFQFLFGRNQGALPWLRSMGLKVFNKSDWLKRLVMESA